MGLLSGLSAEEIVALDWDQIDLDAGTIRVSGESARTLPLNDALRNLITARRALQPEAAELCYAARRASLAARRCPQPRDVRAYDAGSTPPTR